jgi:hypothetical protein
MSQVSNGGFKACEKCEMHSQKKGITALFCALYN